MVDGPGAPPPRLEHVAGQQYLAALDALGFGVALLDSTLHFLDTSDVLSDLLGRSAEEMRGLADPASIVVPERRYMVADRRVSMAAGERGARLDEVVLVHRDGTRIPVEFSSTALPLPDHGVGLLAICRDLRGRLARDEVILQYSSLADSMPLGLIFWDASGVSDPFELRLAAANAGADRIVGRAFGDVIGRTIAEIFPTTEPRDAARLLAIAGTARVEHFADVRNPSGDPRQVLRWQAAGVPGPAVGVMFEDVTHERSVELDRRRLLERLVDTGDGERRRLAMAMHDDPVQKLAAATLLVEALRRHPDVLQLDERLGAVELTLRSAMSTMRQLTFELSPPELEESGLEAAVRSAASYVFDGIPVELAITADLAGEPAAPVQTAAFRIVAEALTNARKHAGATRVGVTMREREGVLWLEVADNGEGLAEANANEPGHLGIRSMRERAATLGGTCRVATGPDGVTVTAELPLDGRAVLETTDPIPVDRATDLANEWEAFRQERASLESATEAALRRAALAEGRLRDAFGVTKAMLQPGLSPEEIALAAAEHLGVALRDGCAVHLLDADGVSLRVMARWHPDEHQLRRLDEGIFGPGLIDGHLDTVRRSGEAVVLDRRSLGGGTAADADRAGPSPHSVILAPLIADGAVFGTVTAVRDVTQMPFGDDDLDFLLCLVDRVAIALSGASGPHPT